MPRHPDRSQVRGSGSCSPETGGCQSHPSFRPPSLPAPGAQARSSAPARRSPLSPARCAAAGSRGGLCSGGAGQDPSRRRVPALPAPRTVGVGTARPGPGPKERPSAPRSRELAPSPLFVIELLSARLGGRAEQKEGEGGARPQPAAPAGRGSPGARGLVLPRARVPGWMDARAHGRGGPSDWVPGPRLLWPRFSQLQNPAIQGQTPLVLSARDGSGERNAWICALTECAENVASDQKSQRDETFH
ncbi:PREDICTED: translation initiation factor IF-2-like [Chinchilla lanigera]|uniref:translation initiation factor IF-2-like n=1 Tax=Chinchilla lanigera TaxID=34839 RepID=UPI0006988201|nr:PREDICTED: translation initiation factor IF-2-like [Chinchilla lanigera]